MRLQKKCSQTNIFHSTSRTFVFEFQLNFFQRTNFASLSVLGFVNHAVGTLSQCFGPFVFVETRHDVCACEGGECEGVGKTNVFGIVTRKFK